MTDDDLNALVERLDDLAQAVDQVGVAPTWTAAASAIRQLMREREEALKMVKKLEDSILASAPAYTYD